MEFMKRDVIVLSKTCPECGSTTDDISKFCKTCGYELLSIGKKVVESRFSGLKEKMKIIGDKTSAVGQRAKGVVSQDKATETVKNLLNIMINVARNVRKDLPSDMIKAIDLEASVSLIAFSIGITIDLEKLQIKKVNME